MRSLFIYYTFPFFIIYLTYYSSLTYSKIEKDACDLNLEECRSDQISNDYGYCHLHSERDNDESCESNDFYETITSDLQPFSEGIAKDLIQKAYSYGTVYVLKNHRLYRGRECLFPNRCSGIEHFLLQTMDLSDYEIIVNTRDWPQIYKYRGHAIPVFSFSKTDDFYDIFFPAWSFWSGGPAIKLYPTGIGRWDQIRKSLLSKAKSIKWSDKVQMGFFRGSRTSPERDELIYFSRENPQLADAAYTKNQGWKSPQDTLYADPAEEISLEDHCRYKYLFNFRGVAASFRFKHLFLCKSVVVHIGEEWKEFFYSELKPWIHYVPLASNYTRNDVKKLMTYLIDHDDVAKKIADRGFKKIKNLLTMKNISYYWRTLLSRYSQLMKYSPNVNGNMIEIR